MGECFIRFRHLVGILFFLDGVALISAGRDEFGGKLLLHGMFDSGLRESNQPSNGEGDPSFRPNLDRDLIRGAAHTTRFDFEERLHIAHRLLEDDQTILFRFLLDEGNGVVEDSLGQTLLSPSEDVVDELRHQ